MRLRVIRGGDGYEARGYVLGSRGMTDGPISPEGGRMVEKWVHLDDALAERLYDVKGRTVLSWIAASLPKGADLAMSGEFKRPDETVIAWRRGGSHRNSPMLIRIYEPASAPVATQPSAPDPVVADQPAADVARPDGFVQGIETHGKGFVDGIAQTATAYLAKVESENATLRRYIARLEKDLDKYERPASGQ